MTTEDLKIAEAFKKCAVARLSPASANRLVNRLLTHAKTPKKSSKKPTLARLALIAASLTLLMGFVPFLKSPPETSPALIASLDEVRPHSPALPQENQLNTLAFLGFCREIIRRRSRTLVERFKRRRDED